MTNAPTSPLDTRPDVDATPTAQFINLTVSERFLLTILLPQKGSRKAMALAASIDERIRFDEGEAIAYGIRYTETGDMLFEKNELVGFEISPEQLDLIRQAVELADSEGRITRDMLPLLDKIDRA